MLTLLQRPLGLQAQDLPRLYFLSKFLPKSPRVSMGHGPSIADEAHYLTVYLRLGGLRGGASGVVTHKVRILPGKKSERRIDSLTWTSTPSWKIRVITRSSALSWS